MVTAGRLSHDDVVRLVISDVSLDFVVDLLARLATNSQDDSSSRGAPQAVSVATPPRPELAYWVATIGPDETATPEQFVASVICGRQLLGVAHAPSPLHARAGDWLCFSLSAKGIVGHARVESIADGTGLLRGSHRFRAVFRLSDIEVYDTPVDIARERLTDRFRDPAPDDEAGAFLASVTREEFAALTVGALDTGSERLHRAG
jgi:hypothetical protein